MGDWNGETGCWWEAQAMCEAAGPGEKKNPDVGRQKWLNLTGGTEKGHLFSKCDLKKYIYCSVSMGL